MKVSVVERLVLLGMLPQQGNLMTIKIVSRLREELSFDEADHKALQFKEKEDTGFVTWKEPYPEKEIEIGKKATSIIYKLLRELDEEEKLNAQHLSLCDKFGYPEEV